MGTPVALNRQSDLGAHTRRYVALSPSLGRNNTFLNTNVTLCNSIVASSCFNTLRVCSIWDVTRTSKTDLGNPTASLVYCNPRPFKTNLARTTCSPHTRCSEPEPTLRPYPRAEGVVAKGFPRSILGWGVTGQHVFGVIRGVTTDMPPPTPKCREYGHVPLLVRLVQGSPGTLLTQRPPRGGWYSSVLHVVRRGATS